MNENEIQLSELQFAEQLSWALTTQNSITRYSFMPTSQLDITSVDITKILEESAPEYQLDHRDHFSSMTSFFRSYNYEEISPTARQCMPNSSIGGVEYKGTPIVNHLAC